MTDTDTLDSAPAKRTSTPPGPPLPPTAPPARRRLSPLTWLMIAVLSSGAAWWVFQFTHHALTFETTDDAFLRSHVHQVSARVGGTVTEVLVGDHEIVRAGQVLARLDATEFEIALEKARAALAQARAEELEAQAGLSRAQAQSAQMLAQIKQAEAQVSQAGADQQTASLNLNRNQHLFQSDSRAVSKADVDTSRGTAESMSAAVEAAKANVESARAQAHASEAAIEAAQAKILAAQASVKAQLAAVRDAERELSYAEVKAPTAGQIGNKSLEVGDRVQLGQVLFATVEPRGWVVANFKETQLKKMHPGQAVEITVDAIEGRTFTGRLESFSPATGAQFALLPPDNASGNFTKVVQRVPVKITFDPDSIRGVEDRLQAGLSAVVNVRIR